MPNPQFEMPNCAFHPQLYILSVSSLFMYNLFYLYLVNISSAIQTQQWCSKEELYVYRSLLGHSYRTGTMRLLKGELEVLALHVFSKHWPSGPMISISRNVRLSVCVSVCSLLRYCLNVFCPHFPKSDVQYF